MRCPSSSSAHTHGRLALGVACALTSIVRKVYAEVRVGRYALARSLLKANALTLVVWKKYALTLCVWKAYALALVVRKAYTVAGVVWAPHALTLVVWTKYALTLCVWKAYPWHSSFGRHLLW